MAGWAEYASELERLLRLTTRPIAYKKFEKAADLEKVPKLRKFDRIFNFCQLPSLVRREGWTVGITRNNLGERCARLSGLAATTEEAKRREAESYCSDLNGSTFGYADMPLTQAALPEKTPQNSFRHHASVNGKRRNQPVIRDFTNS